MDMKNFAKNLKNEMKGINVFRGRLFNVKLFGDMRLGLYKEVSLDEVKEFISDFRDFYNQRNASAACAEEVKPDITDNSNFRILERLCEQYYVHEDTDKFRNKIIQEVQEIVEELRNDPRAQYDLEMWLNTVQDNVVANLRAAHPELKKDEIKLFCYIQAGFTPTMMSVLLQKDKSVVYNRVSRLKAKIK